MAAATPVREIREEAKCPICLEYLTDPVTIECGHNFCRGCITQYCETWAELGSDPLCCPSCRALIRNGTLPSNRQLANIMEKVKQLECQAGKETVCKRHGKGLDLFCEEDGEALCVVCWRSPEHSSHTVLLLEEAAQQYKEKLQAQLKTRREEREKLLGWKLTCEKRSQQYLTQTQTERLKIVWEFQQLRQFLEEQERLLLAQLEKLEEEIVRTQNDNVSELSVQISHLSELMGELEGKCQKPASEFLQDIRSSLSRCEKGKFQPPEDISPELEGQVSGFSQRITALTETLSEFKGKLNTEIEKPVKEIGCRRCAAHMEKAQPGPAGCRSRSCKSTPLSQEEASEPNQNAGEGASANVTLDPDTAHPQLVLSEDRKNVRWADTWQRLPNNPERFNYWECVLGCEGFTSGIHCWEVEVGDGPCWAVGVARESVSRKGRISPSPEAGIWAVQQCGGQFQAVTYPVTPLPLSRAPRRIRVCLDCDRGQVAFIDAGAKAPIFTFPPGSVLGERICPWLRVGQLSWLQLRP
ncbi:tripartite motif-containing protein 10-like [Carettochelys insculpta]|uniref:tripartite motif-containing protein 10-like n=1 Tax=Carettochelys insculpta TaxID=44489 RepID=UPI003EB84217